MKRNGKLISVVFLVMLMLMQSVFAMDLQYNEKKLPNRYGIKAEYFGNTVMVPLRDTFEALGAKVEYLPSLRAIRVTKEKTEAKFFFGQEKFELNQKTLYMEEKIILKKDRALIPVQVISQVLGISVSVEKNLVLLKDTEKVPFRVATINGPTGIAMAQLMEQNYLGENVALSYEVVTNPQVLPAKLIKGEADIAFVPTNMASILYNKSNGQIQLLSTDIWGLLSVVTTDSSIETWEDLKGKQIDIFGQGSTPEIAFKALLEKNGLDPEKDVTYQFSYDAPSTLATAMAAGQLKDGIAVMAEPFTTIALLKNKEARVLYAFKDEWQKAYSGLGFPMSSIVVRKEFLENHPGVVADFARNFKVSLAYANNNPSQIGEIVEKLEALPFPKAIVTQSIGRSDFRYQTAIEAKRAVKQYLEILFRFDPQTIGGKMPAEDFYAEIPQAY